MTKLMIAMVLVASGCSTAKSALGALGGKPQTTVVTNVQPPAVTVNVQPAVPAPAPVVVHVEPARPSRLARLKAVATGAAAGAVVGTAVGYALDGTRGAGTGAAIGGGAGAVAGAVVH